MQSIVNVNRVLGAPANRTECNLLPDPDQFSVPKCCSGPILITWNQSSEDSK